VCRSLEHKSASITNDFKARPVVAVDILDPGLCRYVCVYVCMCLYVCIYVCMQASM
jgi:hypothetical protein